jgi:hypothetical protein
MTLINPDAQLTKRAPFTMLTPKPILLDGPIKELDLEKLKPLCYYIYADATPFVKEDVYRDPKEVIPGLLTDHFNLVYSEHLPNFWRTLNLPYRFANLAIATRDTLISNRINCITNYPGRGPLMQGRELFGTHITVPELTVFASLLSEIFNFADHNPSLANNLDALAPDGNKVALHHVFHHLDSMVHNLKARGFLPFGVNANVSLNRHPTLVYTRTATAEELAADPDTLSFEYTISPGGVLIQVGTMVACFNCNMESFDLIIFGDANTLIENVFGYDTFGSWMDEQTGQRYVRVFNHSIEVRRMQQMKDACAIAANLAFLNPLERKDVNIPLNITHAGVPK